MLVYQDIWQVYTDCRRREKEKKLRRRATFQTNVSTFIFSNIIVDIQNFRICQGSPIIKYSMETVLKMMNM